MSHVEPRSHPRRSRAEGPQNREARAFTQEELAEKPGLDPTYISGIERGLRNSGIKNVARLAKALGLTTAELCKGADA
jgi:transcriptional regulator with XRE-family HTH domain